MESEPDNFNDETSNGEELEPFELVQNKQPVKGEQILYFCKIRDSWQIIILTSDAITRYLKQGWFYNFKFQDNSVGGNFLKPEEPYWGLLTENQARTLDLENVEPFLNIAIDQVDGGITPDSLTPDESSNESTALLELAEPDAKNLPQHLPRKLRVRSLHPSTANPLTVDDDQYIDENLSDQGSIFGNTADEFFLKNLFQNSKQPHPLKDDLRTQYL